MYYILILIDTGFYSEKYNIPPPIRYPPPLLIRMFRFSVWWLVTFLINN